MPICSFTISQASRIGPITTARSASSFSWPRGLTECCSVMLIIVVVSPGDGPVVSGPEKQCTRCRGHADPLSRLAGVLAGALRQNRPLPPPCCGPAGLLARAQGRRVEVEVAGQLRRIQLGNLARP